MRTEQRKTWPRLTPFFCENFSILTQNPILGQPPRLGENHIVHWVNGCVHLLPGWGTPEKSTEQKQERRKAEKLIGVFISNRSMRCNRSPGCPRTSFWLAETAIVYWDMIFSRWHLHSEGSSVKLIPAPSELFLTITPLIVTCSDSIPSPVVMVTIHRSPTGRSAVDGKKQPERLMFDIDPVW